MFCRPDLAAADKFLCEKRHLEGTGCLLQCQKEGISGRYNMTKTLQITIAGGGVGLVVLFGSLIVFGAHTDKEADALLGSVGAVEEFQKTQGNKTKIDEPQNSPFVKQAQAFALFLNPPPKPEEKPKSAKIFNAISRPAPESFSPKFKLIGTSYYQQEPNMSFALIEEPGKGLHWVRQAGKVGHSVIEKIMNGSVTVRSGENVTELKAERQPQKSLVKNPAAGKGPLGLSAAPSDMGREDKERFKTHLKKAGPDESADEPNIMNEDLSASPDDETASMSTEDSAMFESLFEDLRRSNSDKIGDGQSKEESNERTNRLITDFQARMEARSMQQPPSAPGVVNKAPSRLEPNMPAGPNRPGRISRPRTRHSEPNRPKE